MNITHEQYERLMLTIFFEVTTIVLFIIFFSKLSNWLYHLLFWYVILFLQMPFASFLENDFLGRRPSLTEKLVKLFVRLMILVVVLGIFVIIFIIDFKSGIVSSLVAVIFLVFQNWKKIESLWIKPKGKKAKK